MMRTFTKLVRNLLIPFFGIMLVINSYSQTAPSFKELSVDIYLGRGAQSVFIPYITDGDGGTQTVTITSAVSSIDTVVSVDTYSYDNQYHMGILNITEHGYLGSSVIAITINDGVDAPFTGNLTVNVISYETAAANGVNYEYYNKPHYQPEPNENDVPAPGSYEVITTTNGPNETMEKDFFWQLMYGYIIPPTTGTYIFYCDENEGGTYRMNLDDGVDQTIANLTLLGSDDSYATIITTSGISLQAGKPYFFRFTGKDIVNTQPFWIKWAGPDFPIEQLIDSNYLKTAVDFVAPTVPQNFQAVRTGVDFVYLGWDASTDGHSVLGYNVYVNGELVADTIQDLFYNASGLTNSTEYTFTVEAIDNYYNPSGFATYINVTTYAPDAVNPNAPANLVQSSIASDAVALAWDVATDGETEIRGYNVYLNSVKVNTEPILNNSFTYNSLSPETQYDFEVTAIDGGLNESAKSNLLTISTTKFAVENPPFSQNRKAVVSFDIDPIDEFPGLGLQINYGLGSVLGANRVYYGHFEDPSFASGMNKAANYKDGTLSFSRESGDPYDGSYSAKLSGAANKTMNCYIGGLIHGNTYSYLLRFACKKAPTYTGNVKVVLNAMFQSNIATTTITPTDNWQLYEVVLTPTYDGVSTGWFLTFSLDGAAGDIYLDEIEFYENENYVAGSPFSLKGTQLLQEFAPSGVRWGGIGANSEDFKLTTGKYAPRTMSLADMVYLGNTYCGGYTFFSTGIHDGTDWRTSNTTFSTFVDYLAGDGSTYGGALRIAEGYNDIMTNTKQIVVELGNEVWGGATHQAEIGANYVDYGIWARSAATAMRSSSFYDADKIKSAYSGRSPSGNYGLHQDLMSQDNFEVDWLSLSGYMGGNMNLEPGVDFGKSVNDYLKNGYSNLATNMVGITTTFQEALNLTGRPFPMYMYEGNMTTNSFFGTLAQGVTMTDYYVYALRHGVAHAVVFILNGGQWSLIKDNVTYDKYPVFYTGALINNTCKGINLTTNVETYRTISDANNNLVDIDPIGAYAFNNGGNYSVALFSRDLENDYQVQINIPDGLTLDAKAVKYVITGNSPESQDAVSTVDTIYSFADSLVVNLPKYSMVVVTFTADVQTFINVPFVSTDYTKSTSVAITAPTGLTLDVDGGFLTLSADVSPTDAFVKAINWTVVENNIGAVCGPYSGGYIIQGGGKCTDNGNITIKACAKDNNTICDQVIVAISGQQDVGGCSTIVEENDASNNVSIYPNPAKDVVNIQLINDNNAFVTISNVQGSVMMSQKVDITNSKINVSNLSSGMYLMKLEKDSGTEVIRFMKE